MRRKLSIFIKQIASSDVFQNIKKVVTLNGLNSYAPAALSFYMILSSIPCLILIEVFLSIINNTLGQNFSFLSYFFTNDPNISSSIKNIISSITAGGYISLGISFSVIIYLASKGLTFFTIQNQKMNGLIIENKGLVKRKLISIFTTIFLLLVFSLFAVFLIIFDNILSNFPTVLTFIINYFFAMVLIFFLIVFLFYFTSKIGKKKDHFLGAFFSTLGICIGILLYYLYLVNISKSLSYYGPLSSLSLLCLVFFYSSYILFMGVQINIINYKKAQKNR